MSKPQPIGILSFQGDFAAHAELLRQAGAVPRFVRRLSDLPNLAGLILPGGRKHNHVAFSSSRTLV